MPKTLRSTWSQSELQASKGHVVRHLPSPQIKEKKIPVRCDGAHVSSQQLGGGGSPQSPLALQFEATTPGRGGEGRRKKRRRRRSRRKERRGCGRVYLSKAKSCHSGPSYCPLITPCARPSTALYFLQQLSLVSFSGCPFALCPVLLPSDQQFCLILCNICIPTLTEESEESHQHQRTSPGGDSSVTLTAQAPLQGEGHESFATLWFSHSLWGKTRTHTHPCPSPAAETAGSE